MSKRDKDIQDRYDALRSRGLLPQIEQPKYLEYKSKPKKFRPLKHKRKNGKIH